MPPGNSSYVIPSRLTRKEHSVTAAAKMRGGNRLRTDNTASAFLEVRSGDTR